MKKEMNKNIDKMMNLLDELPKIEASPGFYQRTKYKLDHQENEVTESIFTKILKHTVTPALVGASIVLGIFIGMENKSTYSTTGIDAIVDAYSMEVSETPQLIITE